MAAEDERSCRPADVIATREAERADRLGSASQAAFARRTQNNARGAGSSVPWYTVRVISRISNASSKMQRMSAGEKRSVSFGVVAGWPVPGAGLYRRGAFAIHVFSGPSSHGIKVPSSISSNRRSVRGFSIILRTALRQMSRRSRSGRACRTRESTITAASPLLKRKSSSWVMKSSSAALSSVADPLVRCSSPTDCDDVIGLVPVVSQTVHERQRKILVEETRHDAWRTAGGRCAAPCAA